MPATPPDAGSWLDRFFESHHRNRPVDATFIGAHEHDDRLPDFSEAGAGDALAEAEALLAEASALPATAAAEELSSVAASADEWAGVGGAATIDVRLAEGYLRQQRWELAGGHFHRGNPSLYTGEAAFGLISLFLGHAGELGRRVDAAAARLEATGGLLAQARDQVRRAPPDWTRRAARECHGMLALFGDGVDALCEEEGVDSGALRPAADRASAEVADHLAWLESELLARPRVEVAAGEEALDLYLRDGHFVAEPADELVRYAQAELEGAWAWLESHARDFGAATVEGALARLVERRPAPEHYLSRYQETWEAVRALAERAELVTWPDFPIRFVPRPRWTRAAAPHLYFLAYRSPAAYRRPPVHQLLVTPIDGPMSAAERDELLQANNDSVIKLNHVVHHGGIGHHVQNWHAFRAVSRVGRIAAVDGASRIAMACGGTMAEGWACYATDLVAAHDGVTPLEAYAERHTRVRMCARAVVDLELHRGRMTLDEASAYYVERAGMSQVSARAEAVKNSMFPGMAVMYLLGTDAIHALRREMERALGADFDLCRFHDTFLSYGSVPVPLVAEDMLRRVRDESGRPGEVTRAQ